MTRRIEVAREELDPAKPVPGQGIPKGEQDALDQIGFRAALKEFAEDVRKESRDEITKLLRTLSKPDTTPLKELTEGRGVAVAAEPALAPALSISSQRFGWEQQYKLMPAWRRDCRDAETDFHLARYLRASTYNDRPVMAEVLDKLGTISDSETGGNRVLYGRDAVEAGFARATLVEGATTATSGLSGGSGGPLIPLPLANLVILERNKRAKFRANGLSNFTTAAKTLRVPGAGKATAAMVAEGASGSQGEPSTTSTLFDKEKLRVKMRASEEMLEDSALNIVSFFTERAGAAMGEEEDVQIATSNGVTPNISESFDNAAITDITLATAVTLAYVDLVGLYFGVPQPYREDPSFAFFGDSGMAQFLSLLNDGNGRPILANALLAGTPTTDDQRQAVGMIFGKRFFEVPTAAGNLYAGALTFYGLLDGGGIRMRVLDQVAAASDDIEYRWTLRFDGNLMLADAFRGLTGITTT